MKITRHFVTFFVAVFTATSSIAQQAPTSETVVVTVNGKDITVGHVIALADRLPDRFKQLPDIDLFKGVVDQLIQQSLLSHEVDADSKALRLSIENEIRALLATVALGEVEDAATTDELIEKAYNDQYLDAAGAKEFNAAHILVETEDEAKDLVTKLESGVDFAQLARAKSTGPSGPNGGALGWFGLGQMVPQFEQAVVIMDIGAISPPVKTQFGWHVIMLNEKREKPAASLVEVRAQLIEQLQAVAVEKYLNNIELTADIKRSDRKFDPSIIRQSKLLAD
ncbi:MAG TPA: peptidylprolyl isomerase [Rhodobacteraceae bacterium]|nr:peptidylprolyl isomerase [Paracoccaceae bacterium]|tara:strand:- start:4624 stop:5466 length:843 start_codon:yes stop_codon:yes gene_type:complete